MQHLGIRWTIGDVNDRGFEALRLSLWGARRVFGPDAALAVCVNSISIERATDRAGDIPDGVAWHDASEAMPDLLREHLEGGMAEGVAWKLAPLRLFPDRHELALDNDVILWDEPPAIARWRGDDDPRSVLLAEDAHPCFGQLAGLCGSEPRNAGIRGLPPGYDLAEALAVVLARSPITLVSEGDEQGLQVAALSAEASLHVVSIDDVTICSPFPPHTRELGRCGAHFVGLNVSRDDPRTRGTPVQPMLAEHWRMLRHAVAARVGVRSMG